MKAKLTLLLLSIVLAAGCSTKSTQPVLPGAINSFDQTSYQTLMDAQAAIGAVKADVAGGKFTLTAAQKTVFNQAIADFNVAEAAWQTYHAGATNNVAALTTAINQLVADVAAIATQIQGASK
jgi:hypothetical protein